MNKVFFLISLSVLLFACDDVAKEVGDNTKSPANKEEVKPSLSSNLVMNDNTAESSSEKSGMPEFNFEKELHDFGQLVEGEKVSYSFKFTNSGDAPLIISNAKAPCGCTVPNWSRNPIAPGESGYVDVTFSSSGKSGKQNQKITLTANTNPNRKFINITSEVISK